MGDHPQKQPPDIWKIKTALHNGNPMPGPYAHITLINELMKYDRPDVIFSQSSRLRAVLQKYYPYCALGAVSPDYPNLLAKDATAPLWADAMHCYDAAEMIVRGLELVINSERAVRDKQLAWLLGYAAHVAADMTIHPVVQAKVGVYSENQVQHRICEMNQDSYIYNRMNLGEIGDSGYFAKIVAKCSVIDDTNPLDRDIATLWEGILQDVHPEFFAGNPPDSSSWHSEFVEIGVSCSTKSKDLFPLASIISAKVGMDYPAYEEIDMQFVEAQLIPAEKPFSLHYNNIFHHALCNAALLWRSIERAVSTLDPSDIPDFTGWNLDTGRDARARLVYW